MADVRVLIVADNLLARAGLAALLAAQDGCEVIGQISGALLEDELPLYRPDALVYDLGWDAAPSLSRLAALSDSDNDIPIVALLQDEETAPHVAAALRTEISTPFALLLSDRRPSDIMAALNAITHGLVVLDNAVTAALLASNSATPEAPAAGNDLTPREREVLQLLAQGLPNKNIAQRLNISDHTVKFHVNAIMTKLGAQSRTEAVVRATRLGLVTL
ncbi:MAG: response regulator transcription factor [Chloroflexi bacterium]|nr:response regulator transcription factor [Chloroflexota bacterium]